MIIEESKTKCYEVECKCGHTGSRDYYIPIKFAVKAHSGKEAAEIGRTLPRCKHHHKDCILNVREITYDEFLKLKKSNSMDPYLQCHSIQEQRQYDLSDRFVRENDCKENRWRKLDFEKAQDSKYSGKIRIKNPKKYLKFNQDIYTEVNCLYEDIKRDLYIE